jgi:hypothetical protein
MYYTYAYLREDGSPYYVGKGKGNRLTCKDRHVPVPPPDRRIFLKQNLSEEEAFLHEKYMIFVLGRKDLGTGILRNLTDGGEGVTGRVTTEETKRKIKETHERNGYKPSVSFEGRSHSEESKEKIRQKQNGKKHSEETKQNMSNARKGKYNGGGNYGRKFSDEHRRKISEALKRRNAISSTRTPYGPGC